MLCNHCWRISRESCFLIWSESVGIAVFQCFRASGIIMWAWILKKQMTGLLFSLCQYVCGPERWVSLWRCNASASLYDLKPQPFICIRSEATHDSKGMNPNDFGDPMTFPSLTLEDWDLWFWLKYLCLPPSMNSNTFGDLLKLHVEP